MNRRAIAMMSVRLSVLTLRSVRHCHYALHMSVFRTSLGCFLSAAPLHSEATERE